MYQVSQTVEIIPRRLYWYCDKQAPSKPKIYSFSIDETLVYLPYNTDFGPLDLSMICKYCRTVNNLLSSDDHSKTPIYHYTSMVPAKRANSALLICAYQVLVLNLTPSEAWAPFSSLPRFLFFRDASSEGSSFELCIIDCLNALSKAKTLNWFNIQTFDCETYDHYNQAANGNFNWIVPDKFIAFVNPITKQGQPGLTPEQYVDIFSSMKVTAVVRLNNITYESMKFKKKGMKHYELFFADGSIPDDEIVQSFFDICEKEQGIAVHCQAGLGRTATIIGCFVIKNYDFTGHEFIAWARMCRSGSVLGPQQHFLCEYYQCLNGLFEARTPTMTPYEQYKAEFGDLGQAARLSSHSMREYTNSNDERSDSPVKYKTKYNQLVKIDPVLLKLYGKKK